MYRVVLVGVLMGRLIIGKLKLRIIVEILGLISVLFRIVFMMMELMVSFLI